MSYYRFPVGGGGFTEQQRKTLRSAMKAWDSFHAVFHDERENTVWLDSSRTLQGRRRKTRFWMEISDKPIEKPATSLRQQLDEHQQKRMDEFIAKIRRR